MSGRQTLWLMLALVTLALLGRLYVGHMHGRYEDARVSYQAQLKSVAETAGDLGVRLENLSVSDQEQDFQTHFAAQAGVAQMGLVSVKIRNSPQRGYDDRIFTIDFDNPNPLFNRNQLAVFLYNGESQKPRMRTTRLSIRAGSSESTAVRKVPTGADREDIWRVDAIEFKQRTPTKNESGH